MGRTPKELLPPEEAGTSPQHGGANAPKEGNEFSILGIVHFPPLGNPYKSKGRASTITAETHPSYRRPVRTNIRWHFDQ